MLATLLILDICVRPCVWGYCIGCWSRNQPYVYNNPNRWYSGPPVQPSVVLPPGATVVVTNEAAGGTPPLEGLSIYRD